MSEKVTVRTRSGKQGYCAPAICSLQASPNLKNNVNVKVGHALLLSNAYFRLQNHALVFLAAPEKVVAIGEVHDHRHASVLPHLHLV